MVVASHDVGLSEKFVSDRVRDLTCISSSACLSKMSFTKKNHMQNFHFDSFFFFWRVQNIL